MSTPDPTIVGALAAALTSQQLTEGVAQALKERRLDDVPIYLAALAIVDPRRAWLVIGAIDVGTAIGGTKR